MRLLTNSTLCVLISLWAFGCGDGQGQGQGGLSELEIACGDLCGSIRACADEIDDPILDLNDCELEFCDADDDVLVEGGSEACEAAAATYIDCATDMTCQQYNESGIISLLSGAAAVGCEDEASDFRFDCIINL